MKEVCIVAIGGGIGSALRYCVNRMIAENFNSTFPYGTLFVNFIGCFFIGIIMTIFVEKCSLSPYWQLFVTIGFLGGLTTFSSFSYDTVKLLETNQYLLALANVGLNLLLGFAATAAGIFSVRFWN